MKMCASFRCMSITDNGDSELVRLAPHHKPTEEACAAGGQLELTITDEKWRGKFKVGSIYTYHFNVGE